MTRTYFAGFFLQISDRNVIVFSWKRSDADPKSLSRSGEPWMTIRIECLSKLAYIFVCCVLSCINFCPLCKEIENNLSIFCRLFPSTSSPSLCCVAGIVVVFQIKRIHCKKELAIFPSPAGMSLTKLSLGGKKLNYSRPGRVWSVTSRLGTGKRPTLFYSVHFSHKVLRCPWVIIASSAPLLSEKTVVCTVFFLSRRTPRNLLAHNLRHCLL